MKQPNLIRIAACVCTLVALVLIAVAVRAGSLQGPVIVTHADFTCPAATGTATPGMALAQSTPVSGAQVSNRISTEVEWVSGSSLRIGDASISASQGVPIAAVTPTTQRVFAGDGALYCYGIGGTAVAAFNEKTRQ